MKNKVGILALLFLSLCYITSCSGDGIDKDIAKSIAEQCQTSQGTNCIYDLGSFTDFDWDKLYVFSEFTPPAEINELIGSDCKCKIVPSSYTRLLFMVDGEVTRIEDYFSDSPIQFRKVNHPTDIVPTYTKEQAQFYVVKKEAYDGMNFFDLYPVTGTLKPN